MFGYERVNFFGMGLLPPFALQFTRYPPGVNGPGLNPLTIRPGINPQTIQPKRNTSSENSSMIPKLNDYQKMYRDYTSGMLNMTSNIIPPTHPLYSRENSVITLQDANKKLLKENYELKKQFDNLSKKSSDRSTKE